MRDTSILSREVASKVPEVTLWFWLIKVLSTTVGETAADLLSIRLDLGLPLTSLIMAGLFVVVLAWQVRLDRYSPPSYWLTVVLVSIVGTLISDYLVDDLGISLVTTTIAFGVCLALAFASWFRAEGTLSIHSIVTRRRELFYWCAILCTFAMGTSVGDLLAERLELGYAQATVVFALAIAIVWLLYFLFRLNAIFCFWVAYVLTRPLGASIGDLLSKPVIADGMGLGTVTTSVIFLGIIALIVTFLAVTKIDRIAPSAAE
jgi:uncharacterized membrane-anchored protein